MHKLKPVKHSTNSNPDVSRQISAYAAALPQSQQYKQATSKSKRTKPLAAAEWGMQMDRHTDKHMWPL
jgi:hypothetical protein